MLMKIFKHVQNKLNSLPVKKDHKRRYNSRLFSEKALGINQIEKPKLFLLGTCQAERIYETAQQHNWLIKHQLCDFGFYTTPEKCDTEYFDGVLLNPTLRAILATADENGNGDILNKQLSSDYQSFEKRAVTVMSNMLSRYIAYYHKEISVFVISFIEPPASASGLINKNRQQSIYTLIRTLNDELEALCYAQPNVYYIEINDVRTLLGDRLVYDGYDINYTHASYYAGRARTHHLNQALLYKIESIWRVVKCIDPVKLIITDLDNTLWEGVLAEQDIIEGWRHTEGWPLGYAEALIQCQQRGILLAICSKNDTEQTLENFKMVWKSKITLDDFCSIQINWEAKSKNIAKILAETNVLPQNTLFIDDNPLEIAEVKRFFPEIRVLTVPQESWRRILLFSPETQISSITEESKKRTVLINAKKARDEIIRTLPREEFLKSLNLELHQNSIVNSMHSRFERALELINKTNQFNSTGQRWSYAEINHFFKSGGLMFTYAAKDRFAEHGVISVLLLRNCVIEQFVLSCRVFGLGIEQAIIATITNKSCSEGMHFKALETGKNHSFITFLDSLALQTSKIYPNQIVTPNWIQIIHET